MDALTGALVAAAVAWASILLARVLPFERALGERGLRWVAAASLAVVALVVLGVPLSARAVWALLAGATFGVVLVDRFTRRARPGAGGERA